MNETDVVERIDHLAAEEKCPHCDRQFHELALTQNVARMFDAGRMDADYFTREDKSPIVCDGSNIIGPRRPPPTYAAGGLINGGIATLYDSTWVSMGTFVEPAKISYNIQDLWEMKQKSWGTTGYICTTTIWDSGWTIPSYSFGAKWGALWILDEWKEPEPVCPGPVPEVDVEFGPQNWLPPTEPVHVTPTEHLLVARRWQHFTKPEPTPVPASPGYDFTAFQGDEPKYPTSKKGKKSEGF